MRVALHEDASELAPFCFCGSSRLLTCYFSVFCYIETFKGKKPMHHFQLLGPSHAHDRMFRKYILVLMFIFNLFLEQNGLLSNALSF